MEALPMKAGDVWRDLHGNVLVACAQIHGGQALMTIPGPEETPEEAIELAKTKHNLRVGKMRPVFDRKNRKV